MQRIIRIAAFALVITGCQQKKSAGEQATISTKPEVTTKMSNAEQNDARPEVFEGIREMAMTRTAEDLHLDPSAKIVGVFVDFQVSGTPVCLVTLADNTTSLYLGNGGGFLGCGGHAQVDSASKEVFAWVNDHISDFHKEDSPKKSTATSYRFHVRTCEGLFFAEAPESDLVDGKHPFSPLFHLSQNLITAIRVSSGDRE